jgi:hypothetical protein
LYQPFESGERAAAAPVAVGALSSYLKAKERAALFPAPSWQLPLREALALSGPP